MAPTSIKGALLGGVSQLPKSTRGPGEFEVLENAYSSLKYGLAKRPPSASVGTISSSETGYDSAFIQTVNRTPDERYVIVVVDGDLKVFDAVDGTESTVVFPDGKSYLDDTGGKGFRAFTVGDHTFIVNRNEVVLRGTTKSDEAAYEALIFVRQADYGTTYTVTLNGDYVTLNTPADTSAESRSEISTESIAEALKNGLETWPKIVAEFNLTLMGSTVHVERKDGADFQLTVSDGLADKGLRLIKGTVQSMEDLPAKARDGMVVEVTGNPGSPKDNTWVVFEQGAADEGVWRETTAPGVTLDIDKSTMPHELVRQGFFEPAKSAQGLPRQPTYTTTQGTDYATGWTTDGADAALGGTEADAAVVTTFGGAVRTPMAGIDGSHATFTRRIRIGFDIDTGTLYPGWGCSVQLSYNTGSGWVVHSSKAYASGLTHKDQLFDFNMVCPSGTRFELKMLNKSRAAATTARGCRLTAHGDADAIPGCLVSELASTRISMGANGDMWPSGMQVSLTLNAVAFSYTLTSDMTTSALHTALSALIDAHASFVSSYTAPTGFIYMGALDGFSVSLTAGGPVTVTTKASQFLATTHMWNRDLSMTPGEHVGRTIRNLTDGSTGVITANSVRSITVGAGLTGGTNNFFDYGDECVIEDASSAYYVFKQAAWSDRLVGDDTLSPLPSFVDRTISEVFFHAGRLGFTSEDFVLLSATGDLYRFFRRTVTQVLDDDPIDIQSAHKDVAMLDSAVQWNGQLLLSSSAGHQYVLKGDPVLTPATVSLEHLTSFPISSKVRPLVFGTTVVFPALASGYTSVREVWQSRDGIESSLLTQKIPRYIEGDTRDITGSVDEGFLAVLPQNSNYVYVMNTGMDGEQRQVAWNRWSFAGNVHAIDYVAGYLYVVHGRSGDVLLERINVANPPEPSEDHLDSGADPYQFSLEFSPVFIKERDGSTITRGRTQVRTVALAYDGSGEFTIRVDNPNRGLKSYAVSGGEGIKRVPVLGENTKTVVSIINATNQGCRFTGVDWEITFGSRS